jgi:uncharacterized lipoprotein YddW (UPF0748 family)
MRGVWVDAFGEGFRTHREVDELVAWADRAGLDTLVVQVGRRGDAFANDLPLPRADADLAPRPFDPLGAVCERAGELGIGVHAWLGVTPVAQGQNPAPRFEPWLSRRHDGHDRDRHGIAHLDPGHPEARRFVAELAAAVAERYPVAGVCLDRVRYPESDQRGLATWGYNPRALSRYGTGRPDPTDPAWQSWRRNQVTALVDETVTAVRAVRDDVEVSTTATCFGGLTDGWTTSRPWTECGQDWRGWLRDQRVDRVLLMNYRGDRDDADLAPASTTIDLTREGAAAEVVEPDRLRQRFDEWATLAIAAGGRRAVLGTGLYLADTDHNAEVVGHALDLDVDGERAGGWCGYSYRTPSRAVLGGTRPAAHERDRLASALQGVWA